MKTAIDYNIWRHDWKTQTIWEWDNSIAIARLISQIERGYYKTREFKIHVDSHDLSTGVFDCPDLFEFITHYKLVSRANINYPVIMNNKGEIIDWRHRICKAILLWKKKIKCIQILDSTVI